MNSDLSVAKYWEKNMQMAEAQKYKEKINSEVTSTSIKGQFY